MKQNSETNRGGEGTVSVKEPEAKTLNELIDHARVRGAFAISGFLNEKEAMLKLAEEGLEKWVRQKDAVAFAEACVKEAADKLKQKIRSRIRPFRDAFNDGMFDDLDHDTLDNFNEQLKILERFLEEAKPRP